MDIPSALSPHWPPTRDAWEGFVVLLIIAAFKFYRGTLMWRRASTIDRLGWSIIVFDWVMAGVFALTLMWSLYPGTRHRPWDNRVSLALLGIAAIWQWAEIRFSPQDRVEMVAAGQANGDSWDGHAERRGYVRRAVDRPHHLDPAYSIDDVHPIPEGDL